MDARLQPVVALAAPVPPALRRREVRVAALLVAVGAMSLGDLSMTITFLTHGGMIESNPIARAVMLHNSPMLLVLWKMATVGLALGILFYARRRAFAEVAAWICLGAMTWLMLHWSAYIHETTIYVQMVAAAVDCPDLRLAVDENWVRLR